MPISRNNWLGRHVSASVSLGGFLTVVFIQLAALAAPILLGLTGDLSGGVAGLASVVLWFALGVPLSYTAIDSHAARRARRSRRTQPDAVAPLPALRSTLGGIS
jgi:hypothetical protein